MVIPVALIALWYRNIALRLKIIGRDRSVEHSESIFEELLGFLWRHTADLNDPCIGRHVNLLYSDFITCCHVSADVFRCFDGNCAIDFFCYDCAPSFCFWREHGTKAGRLEFSLAIGREEWGEL